MRGAFITDARHWTRLPCRHLESPPERALAGDVVVGAGGKRTLLRVRADAPAEFGEAVHPLGQPDVLVFSSALSRASILRQLLDDARPAEFVWLA